MREGQHKQTCDQCLPRSILRPHHDVGAGGVLDRRKLAVDPGARHRLEKSLRSRTPPGTVPSRAIRCSGSLRHQANEPHARLAIARLKVPELRSSKALTKAACRGLNPAAVISSSNALRRASVTSPAVATAST